MGGGIAAAGFALVNWDTIGKIVSSWIISPLLGGHYCCWILYFIKNRFYINLIKLMHQKVCTILIAIMAWAFSTYII